ncbi:hypothetical protein Bxe_A3074 [Paraburkholderia xenovorans LB400]|uniref:Uncharacterized protein n=1 Tax=Paraburkholderia xenovorans (strain LB400) TaxID=266265 RepID=Q141T4_PARXL|nr:hypothetical protein Bxe_A3074 [Paraburkholderia xenovorans LB400]
MAAQCFGCAATGDFTRTFVRVSELPGDGRTPIGAERFSGVLLTSGFLRVSMDRLEASAHRQCARGCGREGIPGAAPADSGASAHVARPRQSQGAASSPAARSMPAAGRTPSS